MASFDITAQINLRGPTNVKKIAADIRRQLGSIKSTVNLKLDPKTVQNVGVINKNFRELNATLASSKGNINAVSAAFNNLQKSMQNLSSSSKNAANSVKSVATASKSATAATQALQQSTQNAGSAASNLGAEVATNARKFLVFSTVSTIINGVTSAISQGVSAFVEYERELAKVQQVTGATSNGLSQLSKDIQSAAVSTGAAATELAKVSVVLSQAGLDARETSEALQTLAKTTLAPTFGDIADTTEGAIAILRQFKLETSDLETALGSINAVAGQFAVSASDIITAVKQAGAVFASSSQGVSEGTDALNEFIAVFTSVRQTTRESAETIGTGLKTIVTRLQRLDTIQSLKQFGIQLTDLEGKFVGPFEAIRRLNEGLQAFDPRDVRFGAIIEELGGFRQVGKVIPLIQQFAVAQEALNVAREGGNSITDQQIIAERTLSVQLQKTAANFQQFITGVAESDAFQGITKGLLGFVNALIDLADILKDVIPVLAALAANAAIPAIAQFTAGFGAKLLGRNQGGAVPHHFARGGYVPGKGDKDTVPAMLTPGEFVIRKKAVQAIGVDKLGAMNNGSSAPIATQAKANGGMIQYFEKGGKVSVDYANKKPNPSEERQLIGNNIVESVNALASYYDPSAKQYQSRKSPKNIANYNGIVGGVFESAVELVAGSADKQKNEAVWDYPSGLGQTELFNNVPGLGVPTDAKKSASTATVKKKLKAHYRNAKGTDLNRTKFGIVAFGKGEDYEYNFDVDQIKNEVAGQRIAPKAQSKNKGGPIQYFEDGDEVKVMGSGKVSVAAIKAASSEQLQALLKNPKVNKESLTKIQAELNTRNAEANATNVAVVGILPLGYSKDFRPEVLGGELVRLHARGLTKDKAPVLLNIAEGLRGVVDQAAVDLTGKPGQKLKPEVEKATGLENIQGNIFEAVLSALGAVGGTIQNQALDYEKGLGPAASLFKGIGQTWPTEVKRDVDGSGRTRAKKEFSRYFTQQAQTSKIQNFAQGGKVQSRIKTTGGNTITSVFEDGQSSTGEVVAKNIGQNLFSVMSSQASGGGGRALYDSAMKQATSQGGSLTSDRSRVSASALSRIWATYFNKGTSKDGKKVSKRPVPDNMLYTGSFFDESDYPSPDPKSWQGKAVPLQYAYQQFADGGAASGGDTVPAMLTPGEFVINKKAAKSIGLSKLRQLNYADKIKGYAKGGPVGGVQYFDIGDEVDPTKGGSGNVSGKNPCCPDEISAANMNAKTAAKMQEAADDMEKAGEKQEEASDEFSAGQQIFFAFIGPAIEAGIKKAFPNSAAAAGAGNAIQSGAATYQTSQGLLSTLGSVIGKASGRIGTFGKMIQRLSKPIALGLAGLSAMFGFRTGYLDKSIQLLGDKINKGAKETDKAIKAFNDVLLDPNVSIDDLSKSLGNLSNQISDVNVIRGQKAEAEIQKLQPYLPAFEGKEDKEFREATTRQIETETYKVGADKALAALEAALNNGQELGKVLEAMSKEEAQNLKKAIAFQDKETRENIKALEKQRDATEEGSPARDALNKQIDIAIDTGYVENAQRLKIIAQLKQAERAVEENRRILVNSASSLSKYVDAFGTAIKVAGDNFQQASLEVKSYADGFAGVDLNNLFADQITALENPRAFSGSEQAISLDPIRNILGDNAEVFEAIIKLPSRLEDAITSAAAESSGQDSENVGRAISAAIAENLGDFEGTVIGDSLVASLTQEIEKASKGGEGTADTQAIIDASTEIAKDVAENVKKASIEASKLIREAAVQVASFAQKSENALQKFNRGVLLGAQSATVLSQDIDRAVSGRNEPRSIQEINNRTTGAARSEVSGVQQFIQQNADAQKQLIDLESQSLQAQMAGTEALVQNATAIGRVKGEIVGLRQQTENLRTALSDKLGELKNELGNRLGELKEQQSAARSLIDSVFTDEQGANDSFDAAMRLANGDASGINSGPEALKVLKDIARLQQAGLVPDDPKVIENAYKNAAKAAGIEFSPQGLEVFKKAFANPEDDSEVKAYVKELRKTNAEINQLTNVLNLQDLQNSNDALIASQDALRGVMSDLPSVVNEIAEKLKEAGLKSPIEVLEAGRITVKDAKNVDINETLGAPNALPAKKSIGGLIYRSTGGEGESSGVGSGSNINWAPRGSDTVPAMLTPGEYVVNAQATKANRGLLENINSGKGRKIKPIYRSAGGPTDTSEKGWGEWLVEDAIDAGQNSLIYKGLITTFPDIVTKLGGLGDTLGSWVGSTKDIVKSGLASQFTKYGNYEGQILPKYIIEAIKNGTISETTGLGSVPKKAWSNLVPRIINNIGNSTIAKGITKHGGPLWARTVAPLLNSATSSASYVGNSGASWYTKLITPITTSKFALGAVKNLGLAEWAISGLLAAKSRSEELIKTGGSEEQIIMSSIAEFLAGGTSPAPSVESGYAGIAGAGAQNAFRLFSNIGAGAQKGGPGGAVAAGLATVVGMGIRLAEETVGWYTDTLEEQGSYDLLKQAGESANKDFAEREKKRSKEKGATKDLRNVESILGLTQYNRADRYGDILAVDDVYNQPDAPFLDMEVGSKYPKSRTYNEWIKAYWKGKTDSTASNNFSKIKQENLSVFNPALIPEDQKASFRSGDVFNNKYTDKEIQDAYDVVMSESRKRKLAEMGGDGREIGLDANSTAQAGVDYPLTLETLLQNIDDKSSNIFANTRGPVDPETGERNPDQAKTKSLYENDPDLKKADDDLGQHILDSKTFFAGIPNDLTTSDGAGFRQSQQYTKDADKLAKAYEDRVYQLKKIAREKREEEERAKAEEKKRKVDQNSKAMQRVATTSDFTGGFTDTDYKEFYPYIDKTAEIKQIQTESGAFRQKLNGAPVGKALNLSNYVDFIYGKLGPDTNSLLKSSESIQIPKDIATAIQEYRKNYVQSSPLWQAGVNQFADSIDAWEFNQPNSNLAAGLRRALFTGDMEVDEDVRKALSTTGGDFQEQRIAMEMGYSGEESDVLARFSADKENAKRSKVRVEPDNNYVKDEEAAKAYLQRLQEATDKIVTTMSKESIMSLDEDGQMTASLMQVLSEAKPRIDGYVQGVGFYRTEGGRQTGAGWNEGYDAMKKAVGPVSTKLLNAGQEPPFNNGVLNYGKSSRYYARLMEQAQDLSAGATPEQIKARQGEMADERAAADAQQQIDTKRYDATVRFGRKLIATPVPDKPVAWVKYRQDQMDKFKVNVAFATGTSPDYPEAKDIPALNETGVTREFINTVYGKKGTGAVSRDGAKELLRWKAKQEGENAEELLGLANQIDGNVGFNDIYPFDRANDTELQAATDLENIWKETQRFGNLVLTRENLALPLLERNLENLYKGGLWSPERGLEGNLSALNSLDPRLDSEGISKKIQKFGPKTQYYSEGGSVFTPRGTDTIPAMLTPGEYVVNRKAAAANRPLLDAMNGGKGTQSRRQGYYTDGGDAISGNGVNNITVDTSAISKFITSFDKFAKELAALNVPEQITINGTHTVEVNVNGGQVLNDLLNGPVGDLVRTEIAGAFELQNQESEGSVPNPFNPATNP